jgi:hypothetical protein
VKWFKCCQCKAPAHKYAHGHRDGISPRYSRNHGNMLKRVGIFTRDSAPPIAATNTTVCICGCIISRFMYLSRMSIILHGLGVQYIRFANLYLSTRSRINTLSYSLIAPRRHISDRDVQLHAFQTSAHDVGNKSVSCFGHFNP